MGLWLTMCDCSAIKKVTGDVVTSDKKQMRLIVIDKY